MSSHYVNSVCLQFSVTSRHIIPTSLVQRFFHISHLLQEWNTLYDKPIQQPATAANMKAHHCKQFRVSSIQTHMYTRWITVLLTAPQ